MRRPLFYGAVAFAAFIGLQQFIHPVSKLPANDISLEIEKGGQVLIQGIIRSDVQERTSFYGRRQASFLLDVTSILRPEETRPRKVTGRVKVYLNFEEKRDGSTFLRHPEEVAAATDEGSQMRFFGRLRRPQNDKIISFGDELILRGQLKQPKGLRNLGGFDARAYWEKKGVRTLFFTAKKSPVKVIGSHRGHPVQEAAIRLKRFLSRQLASEFDFRNAAFLKALFLGERSDLDGDFRDLFIKTGTMHILAVSGFNIAFLGASVLCLLGLLRIGPRVALGITLGVVWFYCLLVGWEASVVRATLMASLFILGKILGRKADGLNTLGFAAIIILALSPKQLFDLGFQLSFITVLGLILFMPVFYRKPLLLPNERWTIRERALHYGWELFWVSFVALVVTLPVTVQNFYIVTPMSLVANLVVAPITLALFFLGVLYFLTFWWVPKALFFLPWLMKGLMQLFVGSLFAIENLPGAYFIVGRLNTVLWGALVLGTLSLMAWVKFKNPRARAAAIVLFCAGVFVLQDAGQAAVRHGVWPAAKKLTLTVLDVGQGDALYVEFPEGGNMLIDAGPGGDYDSGRRVIASFLKRKGVAAIDFFVISHPQADHIGGAPALFDEFSIRNVVRSEARYPTGLSALVEDKIAREKARVWVVCRGEKLGNFRDVSVEVLGPACGVPVTNINNACVVLKISYKKTSFLLTGDIQEEALRDLAAMDGANGSLRCQVLKVPHHGARLKEGGKRFVERVGPQFSVISVGENNPFGHPAPETLGALEAVSDNRVLRTDRMGAVRLVSDGRRVTILDGLS